MEALTCGYIGNNIAYKCHYSSLKNLIWLNCYSIEYKWARNFAVPSPFLLKNGFNWILDGSEFFIRILEIMILG